jgi:hypothetical protein
VADAAAIPPAVTGGVALSRGLLRNGGVAKGVTKVFLGAKVFNLVLFLLGSWKLNTLSKLPHP